MARQTPTLPPITYDYAVAQQNSYVPGAVVNSPYTNYMCAYYRDYLLKRAMTVLDFDGFPETWDKDYFLYTLYVMGHVALINSPSYGVIPQKALLSGYNIFRAPRIATITNPALPAAESGIYRIAYSKSAYAINGATKGDCIVIKLQPNYKGVLDICTATAQRLALLDEAASTCNINAKFAFCFGTDNKADATTFYTMYDEIMAGRPAVAVRANLFDEATGKPRWMSFINDLKQNFITPDIQDAKRREYNEFDSFVGIPSTNYVKKAHMTESEVGANNTETQTLCDLMLDCVRDGIQRANDFFGLSLSVHKRYREGERLYDKSDGAGLM